MTALRPPNKRLQVAALHFLWNGGFVHAAKSPQLMRGPLGRSIVTRVLT